MSEIDLNYHLARRKKEIRRLRELNAKIEKEIPHDGDKKSDEIHLPA